MGDHQSSSKSHQLELEWDEEMLNNLESDDSSVVTCEAQAPEHRLQPTLATSQEHTDATSSSTQTSAGEPTRNRRCSSPTLPKPTMPPAASDPVKPLCCHPGVKPGERTPVEFNPEERLSLGVINKCPQCSTTATTNVTTRFQDPHNMSTRTAFKAVYRCKEAWCQELFALNSMWDVPVSMSEDFPTLRQDLEPESTKGLLHSCPKCLSTSTKFEYLKLFHTKMTTVKCWGCTHGEHAGESHGKV